MNARQQKTLAKVFADPVSSSLAFADIESLLLAAGATIVEGSGSRVRFRKDDAIVIFHRPHPEKEAKRYQVRDAREFLRRIGVKP